MNDAERERLTLAPIASAPQVGLLLAALEDSRRRTLHDLEGVSDVMLAWQPEAPLNTIGQLLDHIGLIETDCLLDDILHLPEHEAEHRAHIAWLRDTFPAS